MILYVAITRDLFEYLVSGIRQGLISKTVIFLRGFWPPMSELESVDQTPTPD